MSEQSETKERIPLGVPYYFKSGPLAQMVEHLTLNQGVTGSIPVRLTISARVAELADALDLGSSGVTPLGVQVPSLAPEKIQILEWNLKLNRRKHAGCMFSGLEKTD